LSKLRQFIKLSYVYHFSKSLGVLVENCGFDSACALHRGIDINRHIQAMLSELVVDPSRFTTRTLIGTNSFGHVFTATDSTTGTIVALHIRERAKDHGTEIRFFRELGVLAENTHPATLHLIGYSLTDDSYLLVMPFPANGSLAEVLSQTAPVLDATRKSKIIFGIVAGMAHVHARGVLHRDLKVENILLDDQFEPIIGDFGLSRSLDDGLNLTSPIGTPIYMAPELFSDDGAYDFAVDVYAFAVTLYRLFAEAKVMDDQPSPPAGVQQLRKRVLQGARFVKAPAIPDPIWDVITRCWQADPKARPTFWQLLNEFRGGRVYALAGADQAAILEYESRVWGDFGPPKY
jgi:serine/threonine protein kinase